MRISTFGAGALFAGLAVVALPSAQGTSQGRVDFGRFVESQLAAHSEQLFGFNQPLDESALGPYDGPDNLQAIQVAPGLQVSLVSSSVHTFRGGESKGITMPWMLPANTCPGPAQVNEVVSGGGGALASDTTTLTVQ